MIECNLEDPGLDPILGIQQTIANDPRDTVNLTVGVYVPSEGGKPPILESIKKAEAFVLDEEKTKSYLPISGDREYLELTAKLIFQEPNFSDFCMFQTLGGTSALSTGFSFLHKLGIDQISVSNPTWSNHIAILQNIGFTIHRYDHYKAVEDFTSYIDHLQSLPKNTVVLLHASCHNPTGLDFSLEKMEKIAEICQKNSLIPFFDSAYQGFARSLEEDAKAINLFYDRGLDMFITHSYSKLFSMYNERVGALLFITKNASKKEVMNRIINKMIRVNYSNPSSHGSSVIKKILQESALTSLWKNELYAQRDRINKTRTMLSEKLQGVFGKQDLEQISGGNGFFSQLPLKKEEIDRLKKDFGIYLTSSGRMNVAALTDANFSFVVDALTKLRK